MTTPTGSAAVGAAPTLENGAVRLLPLGPEHVDALAAASAEDPGRYRWNPVPQGRDAAAAYVARALAGRDEGHMLPFAIERRSESRIVGSTRFARIERWAWPDGHRLRGRGTPDVCEIGYTWLAASAIRTEVNTNAKALLLAHAFETWGAHAVRIRTDARNAPSRRAIERLGLRLDGIIRAEWPAVDGSVRDSALYSVTHDEWPSVRRTVDALRAPRTRDEPRT
ncbi:MAG: GNAT family N-acetyltransferase [Acidimicrobiia bacterium]